MRGTRHRAVRPRPARRPDRLRPGRVPGPAAGARGERDHPLVLRLPARCAQRPASHRPRLGGRQPLHRPARTRGRRLARCIVAGGGGHRRRERLVLVPAGLGRTGLAGPARRRGRHPARPARRGPAASGGLPGLLAGGGDRTGTAAEAARGDAAAGAGLAGDVRGRDRLTAGPGPGRCGPGRPLPAAGPVPSARAARSPLLVERVALPCRRLRRHGPQHRPRRAPPGRRGRRDPGPRTRGHRIPGHRIHGHGIHGHGIPGHRIRIRPAPVRRSTGRQPSPGPDAERENP